jgi:hypothetical protein
VLRGSENLTIKARDTRRITAVEMKHIEQQDTPGQNIKQKKRLQEN